MARGWSIVPTREVSDIDVRFSRGAVFCWVDAGKLPAGLALCSLAERCLGGSSEDADAVTIPALAALLLLLTLEPPAAGAVVMLAASRCATDPEDDKARPVHMALTMQTA